MNKEELKNVILENVNLSPDRKAELTIFFSERDDITVENCLCLFDEWRESENGKISDALVKQLVLVVKDAQIQQSINSISYHNYSKIGYEYNLWCGDFNIVRDNSTSLYGLISAGGGEVIPCICDSMSVHLDGFIDISFKLRKYSLILLSSARYDETNFSYGEDGIFCIEPNKTIKDSKYGEYRVLELDDITQNLIDILNIKHRWDPKGK